MDRIAPSSYDWCQAARAFLDEVSDTVDSVNSYAAARPDIGGPIQLSDFRPVACRSLVRIGSENDGGYVVPRDALTAADALISFGLCHDWTFERDFKKHKSDAVIHCYDHTVSLRTCLQYSVGQMLRFALRFRPRDFRRAFAWIDYMLFFREERVHFKQRIWCSRQDNSVTVEDVFGRLPAACSVFLKMDIEGAEYQVLDDLLGHSRDIVAMAIEFHDVDTRPDLFNSLVERIKRDFHIVHIHGNNMGGTAPFNFPTTPEITFLHKRCFDSVPSPSRLRYPIPGLDRPNNPGLPDFMFEF